MIEPFHIIVVGAGPAGLSSALSALQASTPSSPIHVTLLELRPEIQTLGGAINLTPLALRYLDSLGVGERLRPLGAACRAIELVAHRTGGLLGRLWPGVDAIRVQRQELVESMMATLKTFPKGQAEIIFGAKIQSIDETGSVDGKGTIKVTYKNTLSSNEESPKVVEGDILIGCDGIHSQVRRQMVESTRQKIYSGKCVAYGYTNAVSVDQKKRWTRSDGEALVTDVTLLSKGNDALLMAYYKPSHENLYLSAVMPLPDKTSSNDANGDTGREGWRVHGDDKASLKQGISKTYSGGGIACLREVIDKCEEWFFFPVYVLPAGGAWNNGRTLLLGDAAHGMPPQGESTGVAIEDGVLLAHVLSRRTSRPINQLFADYEKLRRADIDAIYKETMTRWTMPAPGWMAGFVMEWMTWGYVKLMNRRNEHFARDVRQLTLPE